MKVKVKSTSWWRRKMNYKISKLLKYDDLVEGVPIERQAEFESTTIDAPITEVLGKQFYITWFEQDFWSRIRIYVQMAPLVTVPDPNDPTWCPPGGWDAVWQFEDETDLTPDGFANCSFEQKYAYVSDGKLMFNPPSGESGNICRSMSDKYLIKMAISLKVNDSNENYAGAPIVMISNADGVNGVTLLDAPMLVSLGKETLALVPDYMTWYIAYYESFREGYVMFNYSTGSWIVFVLDWQAKKVLVYNQSRELVASMDVITTSTSDKAYFIGMMEFNNWSEEGKEQLYNDVEVDWVAVRLSA